MILSTAIDFDGNIDNLIDYQYNPATDVHKITIWIGWDNEVFSGSAGEMINVLAPYRNVEDVRTLVAWLAK